MCLIVEKKTNSDNKQWVKQKNWRVRETFERVKDGMSSVLNSQRRKVAWKKKLLIWS